MRIYESIKDLITSFIYFFNKTFDIESDINASVIEFTKAPYRIPFGLPQTWDEFIVQWYKYWDLIMNKNNLLLYLIYLLEILLNLLQILSLLSIFILLIIVIKLRPKEYNNDYNKKSKPLIILNKIEDKIIYPVKQWIISFLTFLDHNEMYKKIWKLIWIYNFNIITIVIEFIAFYYYFIKSFDLVHLFTYLLKLLMDLSVMIDFIPGIIWMIIFYKIFDNFRKDIAYNKLNHNEMKNRGFINERPIVIMACGTMGKKKTTIITDIALSEEVILRNKAFELLVECDLKFPEFPWQNLENLLKKLIDNHTIYTLANTEEFIKLLSKYYYMSKEVDKATFRSLKKNLKKRYNYKFNNFIFDYDEKLYDTFYNNGLSYESIWEVIRDYSKLYLIYIMESSLIISNYSIRTDNVKDDIGNFPLWDDDFFNRDPEHVELYSKYSHIIDYDALRLGKKLSESPYSNFFEFGVVNLTEIGKERKNNLELRKAAKKAIDEIANQENDLFNSGIKMIRHHATVMNYPFVKIITDEQRPESWGADARDLCEIIDIDNSSDLKLAMPFFNIEEIIHNIIMKIFKKRYYNFRHDRGDEILSINLLHRITAFINSYKSRIYNKYGYYILQLEIQVGTQTKEPVLKKYYLSKAKAHSGRFATDAYKSFFYTKTLKSKYGLNDVPTYKSIHSSPEEMKFQNSYFYSDLDSIFIEKEK